MSELQLREGLGELKIGRIYRAIEEAAERERLERRSTKSMMTAEAESGKELDGIFDALDIGSTPTRRIRDAQLSDTIHLTHLANPQNSRR